FPIKGLGLCGSRPALLRPTLLQGPAFSTTRRAVRRGLGAGTRYLSTLPSTTSSLLAVLLRVCFAEPCLPKTAQCVSATPVASRQPALFLALLDLAAACELGAFVRLAALHCIHSILPSLDSVGKTTRNCCGTLAT